MVAAAGCLSLVQETLRATLAAVTAFQALVDAEDAAQALASIHQDELPAPVDDNEFSGAELVDHRPYAVIRTAPGGFHKSRIAGGDQFFFDEGGTLELQIVQDTPVSVVKDPAEAQLRWMNTIGLIVDGLCDLAGTSGYLDITEISLQDGPGRIHPDYRETEGDTQGVVMLIRWGM
jgi:hypothetical protein